MNGTEIKVVKEIAKIDTSRNGKQSWYALTLKEGQYGEFLSLEKTGVGMRSKYLSLPNGPDQLQELGQALIDYANEIKEGNQ